MYASALMWLAAHGWSVALYALLALLLLPVATIVVLALTASGDGLAHLARTILPRVTWNTLLVLAGTGALTLVAGTLTAWVVTLHTFRGRDWVDRALVLPLAIPTYIAA